MPKRFPMPLRGLAAALALALAGLPPAAQGAVRVALLPATINVAPGSDFDVLIDVPSAGSAFNGFHVVVGFDPSALTLLPSSPTSLQQGCLMTGACSAACGNTFHVFDAAADSAAATDVLICNQIALTGPGDLYRLRFHASSVAQVTSLTLRRAQFYNGGIVVTPVNISGASVTIGSALGVDPGRSAIALPPRVEPNPAFGHASVVLEGGEAGLAQVDILDLEGRVVRRLPPAWLGAGARQEWDGTDTAGRRAPAGLYLVSVHRAGAVRSTRFVLLQ